MQWQHFLLYGFPNFARAILLKYKYSTFPSFQVLFSNGRILIYGQLCLQSWDIDIEQ